MQTFASLFTKSLEGSEPFVKESTGGSVSINSPSVSSSSTSSSTSPSTSSSTSTSTSISPLTSSSSSLSSYDNNNQDDETSDLDDEEPVPFYCGGANCSCKYNTVKPVQYLANGKLAGEYCSLVFAADEFGFRKKLITEVCRGTRPSPDSGYTFRFKYAHHRSEGTAGKPVNQVDVDGNIICSFPSAAAASEATRIGGTMIGSICNGKKEEYKGFRFEWVHESDKHVADRSEDNEGHNLQRSAVSPFSSSSTTSPSVPASTSSDDEFDDDDGEVTEGSESSTPFYCAGYGCVCNTGVTKPVQHLVGGSVVAVYCSVVYVSRRFGISKDSIRKTCKGNQPDADGRCFRFQYEHHRTAGPAVKPGEPKRDSQIFFAHLQNVDLNSTPSALL